MSSAFEHEVKAEEIHRLSPFYDQHRLPLLFRPFQSFLHGHHPVNVDTSSYQHAPLSSYSNSQIVNRTVFALQKIQAFNHHFFTPAEHRILNPLNSGVFSYLLQFTCGAMNAVYFTYLWKNWSFNAKSISLWAFFIGCQYVSLQIPNLASELLIQGPRRRNLAKKYIELYGAEYFHNITDPRYDLHKLEHLHNIA